MLTLTAAICPACIPLWVAVILACLPFLRPVLEGLGLDHYLENTIVRWMPAVLLPALIGAGAWWFLSNAQEPTPSTNIITQEPTGTCHCQSGAHDKNQAQTKEQLAEVLYALGSDTQSELSYCYTLYLDTKKQLATEVPYDLSSTQTLNLHLDDETGSVYAIAETNNGGRALYSIDPENGTFEWVSALTFLHKDKADDAARELNKNTPSFSATLPEHWEMQGVLMNDPLRKTLYASIFDTEREAHLLVRIEEEESTFAILMEADLPIHAVGILRQ